MLQGTYRTLRASPYPRTLLSLITLLLTISIAYSTSTSPRPTYIQASPYASPDHLLDLTTLTKPHAQLAQALQALAPTSPRYATTPYKAAFNWPHVVARLRALAGAEFPRTSFYVIVFRSQIEPGTDREELGALDKEAHREAVQAGWLLKYWFGVPDGEGFNLATWVLPGCGLWVVLMLCRCVWRDIEDAKKGGRGKGHRDAMRAVRGFYKKWEVERLALVVGEGANDWDIVGWGEAEELK